MLVFKRRMFTQIDDLQKWDENFYTSALAGRNLTELQLRPGRYRNGSRIADDSFIGSSYALGMHIDQLQQQHQFTIHIALISGLTVADAWTDEFPYAVVLHSGRFVGFTAQLLRFPQFHVSVRSLLLL
jgi:hypothetical protein